MSEDKDKETPVPTKETEVSTLKKKLLELQELVFKTVDKRALARFYKGGHDDGVKIRISVWDGYVVTKWKLLRDVVEAKMGGVINEQQIVQYTLDGYKNDKGTNTVQMTYLESVRGTQKVEVEVKSINVDPKSAQKSYKVEYKGKTYELPETFIN